MTATIQGFLDGCSGDKFTGSEEYVTLMHGFTNNAWIHEIQAVRRRYNVQLYNPSRRFYQLTFTTRTLFAYDMT